MERPLSTVASMPSDRTLPSVLRTAWLAMVSRLLKSGSPSQTHRRSRSAATLLVARTVVSGTRTSCQLSPRETAKWEKNPTKLDEHLMYIIQEDVFCLHSVNVRAVKERQRGSVFLVSPVLSSLCVSGALLQLRSVWFCTLQLSHCCGVHSSSSSVVVFAPFFLVFSCCKFVVNSVFFYKKEFLACLRVFFSCSAVSSIQLEVIPVPRILVCCCAAAFFFMIFSMSVTVFSLEVSGTGIAFLVNTKWVFFFVAKERKKGRFCSRGGGEGKWQRCDNSGTADHSSFLINQDPAKKQRVCEKQAGRRWQERWYGSRFWWFWWFVWWEPCCLQQCARKRTLLRRLQSVTDPPSTKA